MNSFSLAFSVVCPLFLMMALGYFLRRIGFFRRTSEEVGKQQWFTYIQEQKLGLL
ncbi:MAG: hypothetical protein RR573_06600 [Oscillospiraceae bacterium]